MTKSERMTKCNPERCGMQVTEYRIQDARSGIQDARSGIQNTGVRDTLPYWGRTDQGSKNEATAYCSLLTAYWTPKGAAARKMVLPSDSPAIKRGWARANRPV